MRVLKLKPRHPVTALALAPDGGKLGVVQSSFGFRLFDAITGAELGRDLEQQSGSEVSPTRRHSLHAPRTAVRVAEVANGKPFLQFQTGWKRSRGRNRPPAKPGTSALYTSGIVWTVVGHSTPARRGWYSPPATPVWDHLWNCALSADHRFVAGLLNARESKWVVRDLAAEAEVAALDLPASQKLPTTRVLFTPDESRLVAVTADAVLLFDLPPRIDLAASPGRPLKAGTLRPSAAFRITQPQPDAGEVPLSVLPCGTKVIVRGEKSRAELRDLPTGEVLTVWKWQLPRVHALAVAADGLTAAAAGTGGHVVIWDLE